MRIPCMLVGFVLLVCCHRPIWAGEATTQPGEPVVCLWDAGIHLARVEARPLFVAFEDGTVVCRLDKTGKIVLSPHWSDKDAGMVVGLADREDLKRMLKGIQEAGFFRPPLPNGLVVVDGPEQSLFVREAQNRQVMQHMGRSTPEQLQSLGEPSATPAPASIRAFCEMWDKVLDCIESLQVKPVGKYEGGRNLQIPKVTGQ